MNARFLRVKGFAGLVIAFSATGLSACNTLTAVGVPLPGEGGTLTADTSVLTSPTLTALATPEPEPILSPDHIWVGVDGLGDSLIAVSRAGETQVVGLVLNEGQMASDVIASTNARYLAYLVWNAEEQQRGVATWNLHEPNARLIAQPLPGYRIVDHYLADDASELAYVQVQDDMPLDQADWRVDRVPVGGGDSILLIDREALGESTFPPTLFAWPEGGPLYLNTDAPDGTSQGIYAVDPESGESERLVPVEGEAVEDRFIVAPTLSPDAIRIAYLTQDRSVEGAPDDLAGTNVVHIFDLRSREITGMVPPAGQAIYGVRWLPDGERLLLDIVALPPSGEGDTMQYWALVEVGQPLPWPETSLGPSREYLFDYEPFDAGVAYTVLPVDGEWALYVLVHLVDGGGIQIIPLDEIAQELGTPTIIRVP